MALQVENEVKLLDCLVGCDNGAMILFRNSLNDQFLYKLMFRLLRCILLLKLMSSVFLIQVRQTSCFCDEIFSFFVHSKTVVDFANFTYKLFHIDIPPQTQEKFSARTESVLGLFHPINTSFHQTRQDYEMYIERRPEFRMCV